jgi:hypothetical protein
MPAQAPLQAGRILLSNSPSPHFQPGPMLKSQVDDPEREPGWVRCKLRRAWANPAADEATRDLEALARQLEKLNPDAAGSLREGRAWPRCSPSPAWA